MLKNKYCTVFLVFILITPIFVAAVAISTEYGTEELQLAGEELYPDSGSDLRSDPVSPVQSDTEMSNSSHPLSRNETVLLDLDEFGVLPLFTTGAIFDDKSNNFAPMATGLFADLRIDATYTVTGDFDGDGTDELLIANGQLAYSNISLYEYVDGKLTITWTMLAIMDKYTNHDILGWIDITVGDFDGDGVDEFAMILSGRTDTSDGWGMEYINWAFLWVYDIQENRTMGFRNVYYAVGDEDELKRDWVDIESGDFDGDGVDEIVLILGVLFIRDSIYKDEYTPVLCQMSAFDDSRTSFKSLGNHTYPVGIDDNERLSSGYLAPQLAVGDFDHDSQEEIALLVLPSTNIEFSRDSFALTEVWIYHYDGMIFIQMPSVILTQTNIINRVLDSRRSMLSADVDGDNQQELIVTGYDLSAQPIFMVLDNNESISNQEEAYYTSKLLYGPDAAFIHNLHIIDYPLWTTVADVDCDGREEILYSDYLGTIVLDDAEANYTMLFYSTDYKGALFAGNFDGDGLRVRFTGNSWEINSFPGIIAVLAAPPTQYGIDQNYVSSYTAYGQETSGEETQGNSIGHSSSTSVSFELDIGFGIGFLGFEGLEIGWSKTWAKEHKKTGFETKIWGRSEVYATGSDDNVVVYHITKYRSYEYEIVDHPLNSSLNGAVMSLNVPISSTIHHESVPYFNDHYQNTAPHIGNETFNHTIGRPWTYPTLSDLGTIAPVSWRSGTQSIGQGSGWIQVTINVGEETGKTMERSKSSEYSTKSSMFGIGTGRTSSDISGSLYEIIIGETCIYDGVVGDIADPDIFQQIGYDFGLVAYYMTHPDGTSYLVVGYWVENAVEYHPSTDSSISSKSSSLLFWSDSICIVFANLVLMGQFARKLSRYKN